MNVGPAGSLPITTGQAEVAAARDAAYIAVRGHLEAMRDQQLAEAGPLKRPAIKGAWSLVFAILARIVAYVIERMLDETANMPPDILMTLACRRKEEVAYRGGPPPF